MSEPFVGEIRMFGGNFAPRGWALCDGQLLSISENDALFSLVGTIYGGDGRTTFGLPDLRGRAPMHMGDGPGLSPRTIGAKFGSEQATLTTAQLPSHNHTARGNGIATTVNPVGAVWSTEPGASTAAYNTAATAGQTMNAAAIENTGGSQSHENMQPFLAINFIIALFGIFPSRS